MIFGHYFNTVPSHQGIVVDNDLLETLVQTEIKKRYNEIDSDQMIHVDMNRYILSLDSYSYPISVSNNTPFGLFQVLEKWENPYWKYNGSIFLPGDKNPIGKYLIILGDYNTKQKIPYSIHQWPLTPHANGVFKQGNYGGKGCIELKKSDMENLFNQIELGALVYINKK